MPKTALICGISGQDGAYLAALLLDKGYVVHGAARDAQIASFGNLKRLGIKERVAFHSMALNDFRSVLQVMAVVEPDEVYNLAGQTSVGLSFEQPVETLESISVGTLNLLEAIRFLKKPVKLYSAGSGEVFGNSYGAASTEETPFRPKSPYAVAKATAFWEVANYRESYDLFACTGILFNHESPLRPERFVTKKIVSAACRIASGSREKLMLGDISVIRDWGWAPEYVEAMWMILNQDVPDDYVIATGTSNSLEAFVAETFRLVGLEWREHVVCDDLLLRPSEILVGRADPSKAYDVMGWKAKYHMRDVIQMMVSEELANAGNISS